MTGSNRRKMRKRLWWILPIVLLLTIFAGVCFFINPISIDPDAVAMVQIQGDLMTSGEREELLTLLNSHRTSWFPLGGDDPNDLSKSVELHCHDGSMYLIHYQYYSGFSFDPRHAGEDDYRTIVTRFDPQGNATDAWKMAYGFDEPFHKWYNKVTNRTLHVEDGTNYLRLEDVIALSQKGDKLDWEDFSAYYCKDIGSGLYILLYPIIDSDYSLSIGGVPGMEPMYIRLNQGERYIDIRYEDVQTFLTE